MKKREGDVSLIVGEVMKPTVSLDAIGNLEDEGWFKRLSDDEKATVREEDRQLAAVYEYVGRSRLAAAAHLTRIYEVLGPLRVFERYIKRYNLRRRNAYRAIKAYKNVIKTGLHPTIMAVAMARNMMLMGESEEEPYGVYTPAVKKLPPPPTPLGLGPISLLLASSISSHSDAFASSGLLNRKS